jgi:Zn-dependent protease
MRGTIRLFKLFGINVYLHWSFVFLIVYLMYVTYSRHADVKSFFTLLALVIIIFACVIMHEYGHALAARRYGISTHDITILPIGGVARLTHIPKNPSQELVVVIAGPAVNLAIFLLLSLFAIVVFHYHPTLESFFVDDEDLELTRWGALVVSVANANFFLMLFNLVPAFPMDGGRIFRALMCFAMPRPRATFIASLVGRAFLVLHCTIRLIPMMNPNQCWHCSLLLFLFRRATNINKYAAKIDLKTQK